MPDTFSHLLPLKIRVIVAILLCVPIALAVAFGVWAALRIDADSLVQEQRLASAGLSEAIERIPVEQDTSAVWDDSVLQVAAGDGEWMAENLAEWISEYFGHDRVFILDRNDGLLRAVSQGEAADPSVFMADRAVYGRLISELRAEMAEASQGLEESTEAVTGLGSHDLAELEGGHVAAISVRPIVPSSGRVRQAPGEEALHVSVRILGPQLLAQIGEKFGLEKLAFAAAPSGSAALPVRDGAGNVLGYLSWTPESAAMRLLQATAPVLLIVLAAIGAIMLILLRVLRKTATRLLESQAHARHLAFHDPLTGLPNRALFEERLERALVSLRETGTRFALHYVDLDHFKLINDTLGHPVGDALICEVGRRLQSVVRQVDTVARIGGDEFAVIQYEAPTDAHAEAFGRAILEAFADPIDARDETINVGMSLGSALCSEPASADDLMRKADIALYEAKSDGRGRMKLFQGDMDDIVRQRRALERDLRTALMDRTGLHMVYQPIFDTNKVPVGAEALARWTHPQKGEIPPQLFVRLAEERGLIDALGSWVLDEAVSVLKNTDVPWLAVNISPLQCKDPNLALRITAALAANDIPPGRLQIEITEGVLLANSPVVQNNLAQLRLLGVRVALDDFGTGYTSVSYLRNHGIDKLKIDRSFVQTMSSDGATKSIVEAIVALARAMDMSVTFEGVETADQWLHATRFGDEVQGFLLAYPMGVEEMDRLFSRHGAEASCGETPGSLSTYARA